MIRSVRQSFAAGELAPELHMRSDLAAYQKGAALLRNMIVRRTGSAMKRPGTDLLYAAPGFGSGQTVRMFPFYYDKSLSFVLLVTSTQVSVFEVSPYFRHDRNFALTGWTDAQVAAMRARQAGDTLFVTAPGHAPARFVRTASTGAWTVYAETVSGPPPYSLAAGLFTLERADWPTFNSATPEQKKYLYYGLWVQTQSGQRVKMFDEKAVQVTKVWEAGASVKLTVNKAYIPSSAVGHTWITCKRYSGQYRIAGSYEITAADLGSTGTVTIFEDDNIIPSESAGKQTDIRAAYDAAGYGLLDFHQQRQVLSGNPGSPWSLWFSRLGDLYMWVANRPSDDADPFLATIPAMRASAVRHTVSGRRLLVFTEDGIYAVHSGGEGFSARTCQIERVNPQGAGAAVPVDTGAAVLFTADDDHTLLEMRYSFAEDAHITVDRSVLSRHLTRGARVLATAWQAYPDGTLWVLQEDGSLLAFTYLPEHEVYAWSRHSLPLEGVIAFPVDIAATGSVLRGYDGDPTPGEPAAYEPVTATVILIYTPAGYALLRLRLSGPYCDGCADLVRRGALLEGESETLLTSPGQVWRTDRNAWAEVKEGDDPVTVQGPCTWEIGWPVLGELETLRPEAPDRAVQALRRRAVSVTVRTLASGRYTVADAAGGAATEAAGGGTASGDAAHDAKLPPVSGWDWDGRVRIVSAGTDRLEVLGIVTDLDIGGGGES